jgi:hypothetical protein
MSGQPYKYAKDVENFRNEYMESLGLRANIDNMNLQANKNYKETGALPPQSSMKDNRTTAEILADTEKLKLSIIGEFKDVATPNMMQLVIQRVENSPLNGDGSFLVWLAQNAPEIAIQLKKKYKFGIVGDANDAEQMYLFMQTIFSKSKEMNTSVKSAFDRPIGSINGTFQMGDLDALKKKYDELQYRLVSNNTRRDRPTLMALTTEINNKFNALSYTITTDKYNEVKRIFQLTSIGSSSSSLIDINQLGYNDWIDFTDRLPSSSALNAIMDQIQKSEKNADSTLTIKLLQNLNSLLPSLSEIDKINVITDNIINHGGLTDRELLGIPQPPGGKTGGPILRAVGSVLKSPATSIAPLPAVPSGKPSATPQRDVKSKAIMGNFLSRIANILNEAKTQSLNDDAEFRGYCLNGLNILENQFDSRMPDWKDVVEYDHNTMVNVIDDVTNNFNLSFSEGHDFEKEYIASVARAMGKSSGKLLGSGLKSRIGRPKGSGIVKPLSERIDNTKGIKQGHTHVPFGKYIINKNRLDEDIISFKHTKGYGVKGYPSKKVSRNFSNVMKTIVGGGTPKFDELANLSEAEKAYLHTVSKKAGITDKISVPTPSKDSMEKDIHQFDVMKGEILAGNDSSVLIKQFKLLLLKLSKNGTLPKRECQEIMEDLIQLGY